MPPILFAAHLSLLRVAAGITERVRSATGLVEVRRAAFVGTDVYGLDTDNDGIGCE